jgi:glycosyltransferase involved in cell wall biosynthesis
MAYLKNPFGRIVPVDDPKQIQDLIDNQGFVMLSEAEQMEHIKLRTEKFNQMKAEQNGDKGIYLATVSQGGKDGYAIAAAGIKDGLIKRGFVVNNYYDKQKVAILFHAPYSILQIESPYRIIYTMFESDKIPDDWIDYLEAADKVLVPSKWCQQIFAKSGIKSDVVPLGYDDSIFKFKERENKLKKRKDFTFLHYNAFNIRKGFLEVFKAFVEEFRHDEPVKMIFKTTLTNLPLPINPHEYPNIEIIKGKSETHELLDICYRSDCFVFPSRGEGFGMTPLEAMATGMPAIVPNAHGISEYFDPEYMYEVKVGEECPALYSRYKGKDVGKMVICDIKDLRRKMRWCYEHQDEVRKMGRKAAEYARNWTYDKTAQGIADILNGVMKEPIKERPLLNVLKLEKIT